MTKAKSKLIPRSDCLSERRCYALKVGWGGYKYSVERLDKAEVTFQKLEREVKDGTCNREKLFGAMTDLNSATSYYKKHHSEITKAGYTGSGSDGGNINSDLGREEQMADLRTIHVNAAYL